MHIPSSLNVHDLSTPSGHKSVYLIRRGPAGRFQGRPEPMESTCGSLAVVSRTVPRVDGFTVRAHLLMYRRM